MTIETIPVNSSVTRSPRHETHYLEAGPVDGPMMILIHGWPEIGLAWRHQMQTFARRGFHVIAPDLRGCGGSARYDTHDAYAQREIVRDMIELIDHLGAQRATWIGHDWGAAVVWNIARHHADRCDRVAGLCVPFDTIERGVDRMASLANREQYPVEIFSKAQFEYMAFYHERFGDATAAFEANVERTFKALMRAGDPAQAGKAFATAFVRKNGGWFGPGMPAPNLPLDRRILDEADLAAYVGAYETSGFFGIDSLYMNDRGNDAYVREATKTTLEMPVLFLSGRYDYVCDTERSDLMRPMREGCPRLTIATIDSGHWMMHERPNDVDAALIAWLDGQV